MIAIRAAFVMEQTLGHVTHYQNLATAVHRQSRVLPTWVLIQFPPVGIERFVPGFATNWSVRASFRARRRLSAVLAERRHHALFFHTQVTSLFSIGLMRRIPSIVSLDATPLNYDSVATAYGHRAARGGWVDERKHRLNREAFEAAAALVTWSEWACASLVADYGIDPAKVTVLPPGAGRPFFSIGAERAPQRFGDRPVRLLFVGGDFVRKGGPVLLQAMSAMRTQRRFEVHVVTRDRVAARPGLIVHQDVRPNSAELYRLFREADAFVLPSLGECLSIVLMEASAAGLPIVTTDVGALREAARHGHNALVVPAANVSALRGALEAIVDERELRTRLGVAGRAMALAKFDAERNDQRLVDLMVEAARFADARRAA
jgi:glycosyltransferase involved in cell wall biosynthesis